MSLTVESGIPIPEIRRNHKYPWAEMAIGDSFFVAGLTQDRLAMAAKYRAKRSGGKYTCISVVENGVRGTRVWRIA